MRSEPIASRKKIHIHYDGKRLFASCLLQQAMGSHFEHLGGEEKLRAIIDEFVDLVFDDLMIGFFFRNADRARIKRMEFLHAAEHLGGPFQYTGRSLQHAHAAHRIMGGQFSRRHAILKKVLQRHAVPEEVQCAWIAKESELRAAITGDRGSECIG